MTLVHSRQHAGHDTDDRGLRRVKWNEVVLADVLCVSDYLDNFGDKAQVRDRSI